MPAFLCTHQQPSTLDLIPPELGTSECRQTLLAHSQVTARKHFSSAKPCREKAVYRTQTTALVPLHRPAHLCTAAVRCLRNIASRTSEHSEQPRGKTGLGKGCTHLVGDTEGSVGHTLKVIRKELSSASLPAASVLCCDPRAGTAALLHVCRRAARALRWNVPSEGKTCTS